jgi:hypothetical protein
VPRSRREGLSQPRKATRVAPSPGLRPFRGSEAFTTTRARSSTAANLAGISGEGGRAPRPMWPAKRVRRNAMIDAFRTNGYCFFRFALAQRAAATR